MPPSASDTARNRATIAISKPAVTRAIAIATLFLPGHARSRRARPLIAARGARREARTRVLHGRVRWRRPPHVHRIATDWPGAGVKKKRAPVPLAAAPRPHAPGKPPTGGVPPPRRGVPVAHAPSSPRSARVPAQRPVGKVPNPRKPKLVQDVDGGVLKDMFEIFPDLPRPPRPALRRRLPGPPKRT
jgi:hypothetical protein